MRNRDSFDFVDSILIVPIMCIILFPFVLWYKSCNPEKPKPKNRIEKTIEIMDKRWDKWLDKNYKN